MICFKRFEVTLIYQDLTTTTTREYMEFLWYKNYRRRTMYKAVLVRGTQD